LNKINIITPPDILFNDAYTMLLVYPSKPLQEELQDTFLSSTKMDVNVYYFDQANYTKQDVDWLLNIFKMSELTIVDVDNTAPWAKDLLGYMIAKTKTYWLTNGQDSVYNSLSNNKVYNLDFMSNIGDDEVETVQQ
jgi:hypothetical protein